MTVFGHIGGVPHTLVIDNASGAGHRNSKGEVTLSRVFEAFIAHYLNIGLVGVRGYCVWGPL